MMSNLRANNAYSYGYDHHAQEENRGFDRDRSKVWWTDEGTYTCAIEIRVGSFIPNFVLELKYKRRDNYDMEMICCLFDTNPSRGFCRDRNPASDGKYRLRIDY
jgi:hypothetical protein